MPITSSIRRSGKQKGRPLLTLENGDHLTQQEFHRRYELYPHDVKAELIGGVVFMSSPARTPHSRYGSLISGLFTHYEIATEGVVAEDNASVILDDGNEPQPDKGLRVLYEYGGQSWVDDELYIHGPPELLVEIAHSSVTIDLRAKKDTYQHAGVCEYVVVCVEEKEVIWFDFVRNRRIRPTHDGVSRSKQFPGLWLDVSALLEEDAKQLIATLDSGLATPAHQRFVEELQRAHRKKKRDT